MAQSRKKKKRPSRSKGRLRASVYLTGVLLVFSIVCSIFALTARQKTTLTKEQIQNLIVECARNEGIEDHISELEAIATVESNWNSEDVFQSSESLGLPPNTLSTADSVRQGVHYYATLLEKADRLGVDRNAVYQAYNFGSGYLDYVAANGGIHSRTLAEAFSKDYANGEIVPYANPIAVEANGGWRYNYGNMFYVDLIHQSLSSSGFSLAGIGFLRLF